MNTYNKECYALLEEIKSGEPKSEPTIGQVMGRFANRMNLAQHPLWQTVTHIMVQSHRSIEDRRLAILNVLGETNDG